jgi:transcriptional regulator with XRE-family HTH domain
MSFPPAIRRAVQEKGPDSAVPGLAESIGMHVIQIRRYEAGPCQPTLDVMRRLAVALGVSADVLIFDQNERGPDEELLLQFQAVSRFDPDEKEVVKTVLDGLILKHPAKHWGI